jgi:hypothetical protein
MVYDPDLAERVRPLLSDQHGFVEKAMFGGLGFLHQGNMCCGVWKEFLILRIGPDRYKSTLARPNVRKFDITGRAMTGWVMIEPDGMTDDDELWQWIQMAVRFVHTLSAKKGKK